MSVPLCNSDIVYLCLKQMFDIKYIWDQGSNLTNPGSGHDHQRFKCMNCQSYRPKLQQLYA
jgi:hypothetical protein